MLILEVSAGVVHAAVEPVISGDSARGKAVFEQEHCVRCHSVNGRGGKLGVDFSLVANSAQ